MDVLRWDGYCPDDGHTCSCHCWLVGLVAEALYLSAQRGEWEERVNERERDVSYVYKEDIDLEMWDMDRPGIFVFIVTSIIYPLFLLRITVFFFFYNNYGIFRLGTGILFFSQRLWYLSSWYL